MSDAGSENRSKASGSHVTGSSGLSSTSSQKDAANILKKRQVVGWACLG